MVCGLHKIECLHPVQPDASALKPANDRYPCSTLSNRLSSNLRV